MIVTDKYIKEPEEYYRFCFSEELKKALIDHLGQESYPHEYSEQDIWEQARIIIQSHRGNH